MLLTILSVAALFAVFGLVRSRTGCTHNCGMCSKACGSADDSHD